ncbi:MAG: hypothetical protein KatS3mg109_1189 [Pirellulaceae bacterium]|nr:MAG: hypothetical protein KatS3mg109_1189 [Pirellulaceae bacterium]GIW94269.1 MAG: hypothetical protein KatS3mg110_2310 [Pirellulaceae bacterium]
MASGLKDVDKPTTVSWPRQASVSSAGRPQLVLRPQSLTAPELRLQQRTTTVGSHPLCDCRLEGLASVHAVLILGSHAAVLRAWQGPALLNGVPGSDFFLQPGDHLKLGNYEWTVAREAHHGRQPDSTPEEPHRELLGLLDTLNVQIDTLTERAALTATDWDAPRVQTVICAPPAPGRKRRPRRYAKLGESSWQQLRQAAASDGDLHATFLDKRQKGQKRKRKLPGGTKPLNTGAVGPSAEKAVTAPALLEETLARVAAHLEALHVAVERLATNRSNEQYASDSPHEPHGTQPVHHEPPPANPPPHGHPQAPTRQGNLDALTTHETQPEAHCPDNATQPTLFDPRTALPLTSVPSDNALAQNETTLSTELLARQTAVDELSNDVALPQAATQPAPGHALQRESAEYLTDTSIPADQAVETFQQPRTSILDSPHEDQDVEPHRYSVGSTQDTEWEQTEPEYPVVADTAASGLVESQGPAMDDSPETVDSQAGIRSFTNHDPATDDSPETVDSVLERLARAGLWREPATEAPSESPLEPETPASREPETSESVSDRIETSGGHLVEDRPGEQRAFGWSKPLPVREPSADSEEAGDPTEGSSSAESRHAPEAAQASPSDKTAEEDPELAVQQYMERLLQRLRGGPEERPAAAERPSQPAEPLRGSKPSRPEAAIPPPAADEPYVPLREAPERHVNLTAMRELALHSARNALIAHAKRHARESTRRLILYAGVSFVLSGICWAWPDPTWPWITQLSGGAGVILGSTLLLTATFKWLAGRRIAGEK